MGARHERIDFVRLVEQAQDMAELEEALAEAVRSTAPEPADVTAILDFLEIPAAGAFDVAPEQAIGYFKAKGLKPTFSYADMLDHQHDVGFTVAKMLDVDMLGQVRASLDSALANGTDFKEWADSITPLLQSGGWWGRKQVVDPLTGQEIVAQLGSPWRLETIFRTNMQTAYAAGAWQEIKAQAELAPFLMYDAVDDFRTRPLHAAWDRKVLPVKSTWWSSHYPPNGYNCRCGVIQLSADEVEAMGLRVAREEPDDGTYPWTNPRTGDVHQVPNGLDPGFEHNAGKSWSWKAKELLQEKINTLPPSMSEAATKSLADARAQKVIDDLTSAAARAQQQVAAAAGKAALERAKALAEEKAAQWAAQQQLEAIAKGKETAGAGAAFKVKALANLQKSASWATAKPTDQLQQVLFHAGELKAKADLSKGLSAYKKAVLDGKTPPPAAVKAFKSLEQADADTFIAKVDAEKKAIEAKAAAEAAKAAEDAAKAAAATDAAAQPVKASTFIDTPAPDPATMVVIGRKTKGGTPGALYQDTATGQKWLVKFNGSADAVQNEVLASKLYNLAGVEAPDLHAITIDGKPALASRIVDGITEAPAKTLAATPSVTEGFAVDAWLANWDVAGLNIDNVVLVQGRALRIDVGGSLRYRAVGGLKGSAFGRTVGEIESLRDGTNAQARQVFGGMSAADVERSVEKVLAVPDADIRAVVLRYGPPDAAEREALAELMIARKLDLQRRFPAAAERVRARQGGAAPSQAVARVTEAEQQAVEASRVNGYGFPTDSDQIEDNMVVVHAYKRADGNDATRGFFKLMPDASRDLQRRIAESVQDADPSVDVSSARDAVLSAVKSINYRADKGQPFDLTVENKVKAALLEVDKLLASLNKMGTQPLKPEMVDFVRSEFTTWRDALAQSITLIQQRGPARKVTKMFPAGQLPDRVDFNPPSGAKKAAGAAWKRVSGEYQFETASFERSFATENGDRAHVSGVSMRYEATLEDGTRIVYFPHDSSVAWAMQGVVKIDAPGRGVGSTTRIFGAMEEAGIKATRATEIDRQHLYLNAFARVRLAGRQNAQARQQFAEITERGPDGVRAKLALLRKVTGAEIEASEGWRQIDGVRQAFGHGRAYQLRPDLTNEQIADLSRTHVLYHNPQGLSTNAGGGVFERLKTVIEGGGAFASLTDRVRRGVPLSGSSVSSDLASGGGDFHFTRVRTRDAQAGNTGVYWDVEALRRMDAITYEGDMFGRTTGTTVEDYRRGQDMASFKSVAASSSNETIFKSGMSIFDHRAVIVLSSKAEVDAAIAWMKSKGYKAWPDGRPLAEVIITAAKHRAKP